MGTRTAHATLTLPLASYARTNAFSATRAAIAQRKTIAAGHQRWNRPPSAQAGARTRPSPGAWKSYHSAAGLAGDSIRCGGSG